MGPQATSLLYRDADANGPGLAGVSSCGLHDTGSASPVGALAVRLANPAGAKGLEWNQVPCKSATSSQIQF